MKKLHLLTFLVVLLALFGAAAAQAAPKIAMCHLPPGNPDNWHTIYISVNAAAAHLAHGDLEGSCLANCEVPAGTGVGPGHRMRLPRLTPSAPERYR